jgi:uncharacterized protein involved in exopolysaccharide biosynthesis
LIDQTYFSARPGAITVHGDTGAPHSRRHDDIFNTFGQFTITDVIDLVRRHIGLLTTTTTTAVALGVCYVLFSTSLYTAHGQLLIDAKVPHLTNEQWTETGIVLDSAQVESQIAVLMSEHIARAAVKELDLVRDPEFGLLPPLPPKADAASPSEEKPAATAEDTPAAAPEEPDPELVRKVASRIQGPLGIQRLGLSYVIDVSFTAQDPERAANIANAIMRAYIGDQISMRAQAARQGSDWLEKRINTLRLQMNAASLKVQEFKARRDYSIVGRATADAGRSATDGGRTAVDIGRSGVEKERLPRGLPSPEAFNETLDELESTAMTYRKMFESALQAFTEAEQRQSYPVSNARIISTATPPLSRSSPKTIRTLAIAAVAGAFLGLGLALLSEGLAYARASRLKRNALQSAG